MVGCSPHWMMDDLLCLRSGNFLDRTNPRPLLASAWERVWTSRISHYRKTYVQTLREAFEERWTSKHPDTRTNVPSHRSQRLHWREVEQDLRVRGEQYCWLQKRRGLRRRYPRANIIRETRAHIRVVLRWRWHEVVSSQQHQLLEH